MPDISSRCYGHEPAQTQLKVLRKKAQRLEELEGVIKNFEACLVRIAKAVGITDPIILTAMAQNDTENYAEILTRFIEEQR